MMIMFTFGFLIAFRIDYKNLNHLIMKKYLYVPIILIFLMLASNLYAQNDSGNVEKNLSIQGPIHKGAYTLGGSFTLGEGVQSLQLGLGYFFTDRIGLGLEATFVNEIFVNDIFFIQILPRYYFPILDNTYLFVELGIIIGDVTYLTGGAGVTYFLNERVGLQGRLNNFNGGGIGLVVLFPGKSKR